MTVGGLAPASILLVVDTRVPGSESEVFDVEQCTVGLESLMRTPKP